MTDPQLQRDLAEHYQWFHRHPERSYEETATTAHLRHILGAAGIEILDAPTLATGLVAVIHGTAPAEGAIVNHVVAIRGDIDALPVTEDTALAFPSENPGTMHACGHDFNMTSALGAALELQRQATSFTGTVKVVFQPAEEVAANESTPTGAVYILNSGVLDNVETIFGVHDTPALEVSTFGISAGPVSGAVSKFQIQIQGRGSHAAHPNEGRSPIRVAAELVSAIETVPGLDADPATPHAVTVTHVESGSTWNVIPDSAFIEGTARTVGSRARDVIHTRIASIVTGLGSAYGVDATLRWEDGSPSVENDADLVRLGREVAHGMGLTAAESVPSLSGEDFSYYQQRIPGLFIHAGVGAEAGALHGPHFTPDISSLADTARLLANVALRELDVLGTTAD
ncbi:MAG: amidohydrolase [Bifidobacteriaceae bacterium]|jgi:amidohydrolase|nr:amidohydrolase [Bifidobacteriaceae bacterium]